MESWKGLSFLHPRDATDERYDSFDVDLGEIEDEFTEGERDAGGGGGEFERSEDGTGAAFKAADPIDKGTAADADLLGKSGLIEPGFVSDPAGASFGWIRNG